jgi:hypothetical protein
MDHAPDVAIQRVVIGEDVVEAGKNFGHGMALPRRTRRRKRV